MIQYRSYISKPYINKVCETVLKNKLYLQKNGMSRHWMRYKRSKIKAISFAFEDMIPVGCAFLYERQYNKATLSVYVHRTYRKRGIGTRLCKKVLKRKSYNYYQVDDSNGRDVFFRKVLPENYTNSEEF